MNKETEILYKLIELLGEVRIFKAHEIAGSRQISFSKLVRLIKRKRIVKDLTGKLSMNNIAKKHGVSRMTVYNLLKKSIK